MVFNIGKQWRFILKVSYFHYCLQNTNDNTRYKHDIRPFLKAYCAVNAPSFKNQFSHQGENVYLIHHVGDVFLFLITRSKEIIRRIKTDDLTVSEVHSLLAQNEHLSFASYVIVKESCIGIGSTLLAPRQDVLWSYIGSLLTHIGLSNWALTPRTALVSATRTKAMEMSFIGKTHIELDRDNSFTQDLFNLLSGSSTDYDDVSGIQITLIPKLRKNIKPAVQNLLAKVPEENVDKLIIRAKQEEAASLLTDLYIVGSGGLSDSVDAKKVNKIAETMEKKFRDNAALAVKINEYCADEGFENGNSQAIAVFNDIDAWTNFIPTVPTN
ncbi:hypothetical protein [Rheinheimera soli]|uniref:hypothetical protein n=1 Tax=Rheinheimera soli TaxID=443616 RepID=UPI001E60A45F|nr:hypothetical protein [Rheinheimera soli]